jgi:nucleotide-binding universal stress UspA family protein
MKVKKILAPVDFSDMSEEALSYATGLAADLGSKVVLLHAIEPIVFANAALGPGLAIPHLLEEQRQAAVETLDKLVARLRKRKVDVTGAVVTGAPYDAIVNAAKSKKCDLIVMGTHGRSGLGHLLLGSTAEKVVRLAECPVLTIRGSEKATAAKAGKKKSAKRTGGR